MMIVDEFGNIYTKSNEQLRAAYCYFIKLLDLILEYSSEDVDEDGTIDWILIYDDEMREQMKRVRERLT